MSTDPVQLYVSYLTTNELAASIQRITDKLSTPGGVPDERRRRLLITVRDDMHRELGRRQLTLLEPTQGGESE